MMPCKCLKRVALSASPRLPHKLLMNVNKPGKLRDSFAWA
jgi:hypothetical protein